MRIAVVLLVATTAEAGVPTLPRHYAALFEPNHHWTYDVSLTFWDAPANVDAHGKMKKKTVRSVIDCKVARVQTFSSAIVSEVRCSDDLRVAGFYAATAAGLYSLDAWPAIEADLGTLDAPWISSKPTAFRKVTRITEPEPGEYIEGVKKQGLGWCVYSDSHHLVDGGPTSVCFDRGIASGLQDTGGELHRLEYKAR